MSIVTPMGVKLAEMKASVEEKKFLQAKEKMTSIQRYTLDRQRELHLQILPEIRRKALRWSLIRTQHRRRALEDFLHFGETDTPPTDSLGALEAAIELKRAKFVLESFGETDTEPEPRFISSIGDKGDKVSEVKDISHKEKLDLCSNNSSGEVYKDHLYNFGDTYIGPIFKGSEEEHTTMNYF